MTKNLKSCHTCKFAYPNYINYIEGPCTFFELYFGENNWTVLDFNVGCKFWQLKEKIKIKEAKDYFYVDDPKCDKEICPFCESKNYGGGGSWSPDGCLDCGAIHFFGAWFKDKNKENKNEKI